MFTSPHVKPSHDQTKQNGASEIWKTSDIREIKIA